MRGEAARRLRGEDVRHVRHDTCLCVSAVLYYRGPGPKERSVRCAMPPHGKEGPSAAAMARAALELLQ